ncbi:MAG: DUF3099 domain-containing protein [Ornithinimicrobium sp.]
MPTDRRAQAVTSARPSRVEDRQNRMRVYLITMGIRVACFPLSVWALMSGYIIIGSLLAGAAIILPGFAMMLANNKDTRRSTSTPVSPVRALPQRPSPRPDDL